jgi:ribonuclease PH
VEVQGSAENGTFSPDELQRQLTLALKGCAELAQIQQEILRG